MVKPNYMLIGASKCATSTICTLLGQHPDIFMTEPKEPNFFCNDEVFQRGFEWYESLYAQGADKKMRGEGTNRYTMKEVFPKTIERIVSYTTDLKLIYVVRNPIDRIASYWLQKRSHGGEEVHYDFNTAVRVNRNYLVDSSNYWQQINVYREYFSDDRICVMFYEDFQVDTNAFMRRCFEFLEVDPDVPLANDSLHLNPSSGKKVPIETLSRLRSYSIFRAGVKLIPTGLRETIKQRFLFKESQGRPQWNPETLEWALDILEFDTIEFLKFYGKSEKFWSLRN